MIWQGVFAKENFELVVFLGGLGVTGSPLGLEIIRLFLGRGTEPSSPSPEQPPSPEASMPSSGR